MLANTSEHLSGREAPRFGNERLPEADALREVRDLVGQHAEDLLRNVVLTPENLDGISQTEDGRARIRKEVLDANGRVILKKTDAIYEGCKIHHLFRGQPLWLNGRAVVYGKGHDGETYYDATDVEKRRRVRVRAGDKISSYPAGAPAPKGKLSDLCLTEEGRMSLRAKVLDGSGKVILTKASPYYQQCRIDYLFRGEKLLVNGKPAVYRKGKDGLTYYYESDVNATKRVVFHTGDTLVPLVAYRSGFGHRMGLSLQDELRLNSYHRYTVEGHDANVVNRTFPHRFQDHETLLKLLLHPRKSPVAHAPDFAKGAVPFQEVLREVASLRKDLFPRPRSKPFFIDIGPGLANADTLIMQGKGKPAVTSQEIAAAFPTMPVAIVELPENVDIFMGRKEGTDQKGQPYSIGQEARRGLLDAPNLHIVAGNGLESLKDQWSKPSTNPIGSRVRPLIDQDTTLVIRACNSIDIYCAWGEKNGPHPSVSEALSKMADDFFEQPILLFFNREILVKKAKSRTWSCVGRVSPRGFRHDTRDLGTTVAPFEFDRKKLSTHRVEGEKAQVDYLNRTYGKAVSSLAELSRQVPPMHEQCKMSINLPAYREAKNIEKALEEYTVRQIDPLTGAPLDPDSFEVNVLLNRPREAVPFDADTEREILAFKRRHPEYHIHLIKKTFDFPGKPVMGEIYKTAADLAVFRNMQRPEGNPNRDRLILRTGGADAKDKNPYFLATVIDHFEKDPSLVQYRSESRYPKELLEKVPLINVLYVFESGLNRLYTRGKSNIGLGSYTAEVYAKAGGFNKKDMSKEEMGLCKRIGREVQRSEGKYVSRKDFVKNAIDDPRRALGALHEGIGMARKYDNFGDMAFEARIRDTDWMAKLEEEGVLPQMELNPENLSRELSHYYRQFLNVQAPNSNTITAFQRQTPPPSKEEVQEKIYEFTDQLVVRMLTLLGLREQDYELIHRSSAVPEAQIVVKDVSNLKTLLKKKEERIESRGYTYWPGN